MRKRHTGPLQFQELLLDGEPAPKTDQRPGPAEHAVARDNDGHGIPADCRTHGTTCPRVSDTPRNLAVRDG